MERNIATSTLKCVVGFVAVLDQAIAGFLFVCSVVIAVILPFTPLFNVEIGLSLCTLLLISTVLVMFSRVFMAWFSVATRLFKAARPGSDLDASLGDALTWQILNATLIIAMMTLALSWSIQDNVVEDEVEYCLYAAIVCRLVFFFPVCLFISAVTKVIKSEASLVDAMEMV